MKHDPLLLEISFVIYMARSEHCSENGKLVEFWRRLEQRARETADEFDLEVECYGSSVYVIGGGLKPDNSGRCVVCNKWVSAQNKPNIIKGLGMGVEYNEQLYCSKHLPEAARHVGYDG